MTSISVRIPKSATLTTTEAAARTLAAWAGLASRFQTISCVITGGHYRVLHTAPDKLALRCVACGHMSPGWDVGATRFVRTMPSKPERLQVRRPVVA